MTIMRDAELYDRLREVLGLGWVDLPNEAPFRGTGGPGKMLERLLGLDGGNFDSPDSGRWEIKYHSGTALLTLFHLEGEPKGHMRGLIQNYGWADRRSRTSFRHTIHASSERGFYVVNENNRIIIRNHLTNDFDLAYWTHDRLITAFAAKFRRMILVSGTKRHSQVNYETADLYRDPQTSLFVKAVEEGIVAVDFDARTTDGAGIRNHGTKFRIRPTDLHRLYHNTESFI